MYSRLKYQATRRYTNIERDVEKAIERHQKRQHEKRKQKTKNVNESA
jgi:hypothetical protein